METLYEWSKQNNPKLIEEWDETVKRQIKSGDFSKLISALSPL